MTHTRTWTIEEMWHEWFGEALDGIDALGKVTWDLAFDGVSFWFDLEEVSPSDF